MNTIGKINIIHEEKVTGKGLRKIMQQLFLMCYILNIKRVKIIPQ